MAHPVVAALLRRAGHDQVPYPGQAQVGDGIGAALHGEAGHLGQGPGDQHAAGVLAHRQGRGHTGDDGVDVLQGAGQFHAKTVGTGIDAEGAAVQRRLDPLAHGFVLAGHHGGGELVLGDLAGEVGPGDDADARPRHDFREDLAHQHEGMRLDALGGADEETPFQLLGDGCQGLAQRARRQRHQDQLAALDGALQVTGGLDRSMHLDTLQIARILALAANGLGLLRIAHPQAHRQPVLGDQIGQGGTEAAAA